MQPNNNLEDNYNTYFGDTEKNEQYYLSNKVVKDLADEFIQYLETIKKSWPDKLMQCIMYRAELKNHYSDFVQMFGPIGLCRYTILATNKHAYKAIEASVFPYDISLLVEKYPPDDYTLYFYEICTDSFTNKDDVRWRGAFVKKFQ